MMEIHHMGGVQRMKLDLRAPSPGDGVCWHDLGTYEYAPGDTSEVIISNKDADGYVVVDAVRWVAE